MSLIRSVRGFSPKIDKTAFVAENATIIGDVKIGKKSSIWYNAVLRGDVMPIHIGEETNIQDGTIIHGTYKECGVTIHNRVTIGHLVMLHGCEIQDLVLVGMGSIIMDRCLIAEKSIVGAGSLVTEGSSFPPGSLIIGRPAKVKRPLTSDELMRLELSANRYLDIADWYK